MLISSFSTAGVKEEIKRFEEKYHFHFPNQYQKFLGKYNGGRTPKTNFKIAQVSSDLGGFYGLGQADEYFNFHYIEKRILFSDFLEDEVLPVGSNSFGDNIVMRIGTENKGKMYFYYHDRPKKYILLTDDFITFTQKCKSEKIGHIRTIEERSQNMINHGIGDQISQAALDGWQAEIDLYSGIKQEKLVLDA